MYRKLPRPAKGREDYPKTVPEKMRREKKENITKARKPRLLEKPLVSIHLFSGGEVVDPLS